MLSKFSSKRSCDYRLVLFATTAMLINLFCMFCFASVTISQYTLPQTKKEHTYKRTHRKRSMLYLFGIIIGLIFIIYCFSNGLKEQQKNLVGRCQGRSGPPQSPESLANKKKKDLNDEDFHLLARILSVGLVDADPNYLHHLKGYRDLRGAST